jgi:hypothetical protein
VLSPLQRAVLFLKAGDWQRSEMELANASIEETDPKVRAALQDLQRKVNAQYEKANSTTKSRK